MMWPADRKAQQRSYVDMGVETRVRLFHSELGLCLMTLGVLGHDQVTTNDTSMLKYTLVQGPRTGKALRRCMFEPSS